MIVLIFFGDCCRNSLNLKIDIEKEKHQKLPSPGGRGLRRGG
jgi:hypothetical protein